MRYNTANATTRRFHGENARRDISTNQNMSSESSFQPRSTRRRRRFRRRRNCNNVSGHFRTFIKGVYPVK